MKLARLPVLLAVGLMLGAACAPQRKPLGTGPPLVPLRQATAQEVLAAFNAYCNRLESLSASGHLNATDRRSGRTRRVSVRLVGRRGGELYLKGSVAVVTALELVSSGERFWLRLPREKKIWTGSTSAPEAVGQDADAPYRALRPRDLMSALLPEPLVTGPTRLLAFEADPRAFALLLMHTPAGQPAEVLRRVWLDRATLRLVRLNTYALGGELRSEAHFAGWRDGFPHQVRVERLREGYSAAFEFDRLSINVPVPDRAFVPRLPENHTVIEVD